MWACFVGGEFCQVSHSEIMITMAIARIRSAIFAVRSEHAVPLGIAWKLSSAQELVRKSSNERARCTRLSDRGA
jgi:hypothetical protein